MDISENMERGQRMQQGLWGKKKKTKTNPTKNSHKQAKPEEDWIKNTSQKEKQG